MVYAGFPNSPEIVTSQTSAEFLRSGGCGEFSTTLPPCTSSLIVGDAFEIYQDATKVFTGTVTEINGTNDNGFVINGSNLTLLDLYFAPNLVIPPLTERASWLQLKGMIEELCGVAGITIYDMSSPALTLSTVLLVGEMAIGGKSLRDALDEFALKTSSPICWGVDAFNRIYVSSVSDTIWGSTSKPLQATDRFTYTSNGMSKYKAVQFYGNSTQTFAPIHQNGTFARADSRYATMRHSHMNLYSDQLSSGVYNDTLSSGFPGADQFTTNAGASIQTYNTTQKVYEVDNVGEYIEKIDCFHWFAPQNSKNYIVQFDGWGESLIAATPVTTTTTLTFNGVATSVSFLDTFDSVGVKQVRHQFTMPVGTTTVDLQVTMTAGVGGGNRGVGIHNIRIFPDDEPFVSGWDVVVNKSSTLVQIVDYHLEQGGLYLKTNFSAGVVGASDFSMLRASAPQPVVAGREYKWIAKYKGVIGQPWHTDFYVVIEGYDTNGNFVSAYTSPVISVGQPLSYTLTSNTFFVPENVTQVVQSLRFTSRGTIIIGALTLRDAKETSTVAYGDSLVYYKNIGGTGRVANLSGEAGTIQEADDYIIAWLKTQTQSLVSPEFDEEIEADGILLDVQSIFQKPVRITETNISYPLEAMQLNLQSARSTWKLNVRKRTLEDYIARRVKTSSGL